MSDIKDDELRAKLHASYFRASGGFGTIADVETERTMKLIKQYGIQERIGQAQKARDVILYDEQAIDSIDEQIWQLKQKSGL